MASFLGNPQLFFETRKRYWYRLLRFIYGSFFVVLTSVSVVFIWSAPEWAEVDLEHTRVACGPGRSFGASEVNIPLVDLLTLISGAGASQPPVYALRAQIVGELAHTDWEVLGDLLKIEGARADGQVFFQLSRGARERISYLCGFSSSALSTRSDLGLVVYPEYKEPYTTMNKIVYTHLTIVLLFIIFEVGRRYFYHILFGTYYPTSSRDCENVLI